MHSLLLLVSLLPAATPLPKAPPGFKVELVLEAPAIEAPTALCVAPNGDVYFAEDPMDMSGPPTKNLDRIWLLKGGDPAKKILFAEKMWAVMGLEIVGDKMYCVHAPYVTVFTLNPDGTAKSRSDLFTDLGPPVAGVPSFNDHIPSGIRMGMDGYLYVSIGDKGIPKMSRIPASRERQRPEDLKAKTPVADAPGSPDIGSVHVAEGRWRHSKEGNFISLEGGGVIRFRPDGSNLEVFASGTRNHLDVPMDEHDRIFVRDNTDDGLGWNTRLMYLPRGGFMGYPWAYTKRPAETLPMIHDFGGGAPCGGWVYCDDGLPETYRGRIFHCEWGQGKVYAVKVAPDGAGFKYVDQIKFLDPDGTDLKDFRPFTLRPTADGRGFYVTDWGFGGWLQKMKAGRIWKVTYTGDDVKPAPRGKDTDSVEQLIASLSHPAHSERLRAQRALKARGKDVVRATETALDGSQLTDAARSHELIGLLWILAELSPTKVVDWIRESDAIKLNAELRIEVLRLLDDERIYPLAQKRLVGPVHFRSGAPMVVGRNVLAHELSEMGTDKNAVIRLFAAQIAKHEPLEPPDLFGFAARRIPEEKDVFVLAALLRATRETLGWRYFAGSVGGEENVKSLAIAFDKFAEMKTPVALGFAPSIPSSCRLLTERFDAESVFILRAMLQMSEASVRQRAVETLARNYKDRKPYAGTWWGTQPARHGPPKRDVAWEGTPIVREAVVKALSDPAPEVRRAALTALVHWADPETLPALKKQFVIEKDVANRLDLIRAIANMDMESPDSGYFLDEILANRSNPSDLRQIALKGVVKSKMSSADACVAHVTSVDDPPELHALALRILGEMKSIYTRPACEDALKSTRNPQIIESAMKALASQGDPNNGSLVLPELTSRDVSVRRAAIQTVGVLKLRGAVPELIRLSRENETEFESLSALASMPDSRALSAYLTGLTSKNADLRSACRTALGDIRDTVAPSLEELAKRNELPPAIVSELKTVYEAYAPITAWKLIGPFAARDRVHSPETEQKFDATYDGADKKVRWRDRTGDPNTGRVNLARYTPSENVCIYGFAEITSDRDRDAKLRLGSDDTLTVWLNGAKVYEFNESRAWAPDQARVSVKLAKGVNRMLIKCGNFAGPWEFSVAVSGDVDRYTFLHGGPAKFDLEEFRKFARKTPGDPVRGQKLFLDARGLACVKCHAVEGKGGAVGPDLAGIGLKYQREDLMTSVLEPSKVIAQGYETINVSLKSGKSLMGVFKGETADAIRLADADGKEHTIPKTDIDEKSFSPVSMMPNGLNEGMTLQDFADVIAYLGARKEDTPQRHYEDKKPK